MKKLLVGLLAILLVPTIAFAKEYNGNNYNTLNLAGALTEEKIEFDKDLVKENDKQATIYLFRGNGCGYCKRFLTFLTTILKEYGEYFKVESFEVWYDKDNAKLMEEVAEFLDEDAEGVPFIVIGDKVFAGYTSSYDEDIKTAIKNLYNSSERYDVFAEMEKANKEEATGQVGGTSVIIWNAVIVVLCAAGIIGYNIYANVKLNERIAELEKKVSKK